MKVLVLAITTLLFFNACSQKKYFEPEESNLFYPNEVLVSDQYIKSFNTKGASLENGSFIDQKGIVLDTLPDGFEYLNYVDNTIIAADKNKKILVRIDNQDQIIQLSRNTIAASKEGDLLYLVFSDNALGIYDIQEKQFKLKEYGQHAYLNDIRIASPLILNNIVLFPTLDGKVLVVDKRSFKLVRTITIDPDNQIKNIILLQAHGDTLIVASQNKIVTINNGKFNSKEFFIQNSLVTDEGIIYIVKLDGTIVKYDLSLQELASQKFKFARVLGMEKDKKGNIFALELSGYLIKIDSELKKYKVYSFPFENDEKIFATNGKIYFENKILFLDLDK